jgi:predicted nucleic-acid-binding Zn-ribbon protein
MKSVIIRSFHNSIPAQMTSAKLEEAGIKTYVTGEGAVSMLSISNSPSGGIHILVDKSDEEKAKQLLYEFDEAYRKAATCTKCGSNDFIFIQSDHISDTFFSVLRRIISGKSGPQNECYQCVQCGNRTEELPEPPGDYYSKDLL